MQSLADVPVKVWVLISALVLSLGALMIFLRWLNRKSIAHSIGEKNLPKVKDHPFVWVFFFIIGYYPLWINLKMQGTQFLLMSVITFFISFGVFCIQLRDREKSNWIYFLTSIIFIILSIIMFVQGITMVDLQENFFSW